MIRRSMMASEVGAMLAPGHGAMHTLRPMRRRHQILPMLALAAGVVLAGLAALGYH